MDLKPNFVYGLEIVSQLLSPLYIFPQWIVMNLTVSSHRSLMASLVCALTSATASFFRMKETIVSVRLNYPQLEKGCVRPQTSVASPRRSYNLYIVTLTPYSRRCKLGCVAVAKNSLEVCGEHLKAGVLGPTNFKRSETLDDSFINISSRTSDLEGQLQELLDEVKSMIKSGKEDEAMDLLLANYEAVKEQVEAGAKGIEEAAVLDVIALGYMALGDLRTVESLMDMVLSIVNGLGDDQLFLDSILMHMGSMYAKLEKFTMAISVYKRSMQIMERKYGNKSSLLCTILLGMAKVQVTSAKTTEAIDTYNRIISILESNKGKCEELLMPLSALGDLLMKEERTLDAEHISLRVLNICRSLYGENDGRAGAAMYSLARVKCAKGEVNEAIDLYKNAIKILVDSRFMALEDEVVGRMRIDLAELLHIVGRGREGRALLEECLAISENSKGKEHPDVVPHLVNLAASYSRSKNFAEGERLLRISLQIMNKTLPCDDPSITFPMLHLAVTLYNLNRDEEAEALALEVVRIREEAFGKDSIPVGEALDCLVSIQTRLEKDDDELVELLKRVLKIQEKAFGPNSEQVVETLKKIVHYLDKLGLKNEKYPMQRRISFLRSKYKDKVTQ